MREEAGGETATQVLHRLTSYEPGRHWTAPAGDPRVLQESTGFSLDTLRWYEREGLFPRVQRDSSQRRRYSPRDVALLRTLARLRRTGMPTREMREFTRLVTEGAATHGQRLALLAAHQERIVARLAEMQDDLAVLEKKVEHYQYLIEQGLDCDAP